MDNKILTKIHRSVTSAYKKDIAKVTQPGFAKLLGISPSTVAKWEAGNNIRMENY